MQKKHVRMIFGITVGICGAAAADVWPSHAAAAQMTFFSLLSLGAVVIGLWSDRNRPRYLLGMCTALLFHGAFLYLARSIFPFKTVLMVVPVAIIEAAVLFAIMLKILGKDEDANRVRLR